MEIIMGKICRFLRRECRIMVVVPAVAPGASPPRPGAVSRDGGETDAFSKCNAGESDSIAQVYRRAIRP
jgi:hypothetical protein